MHSEEFYVLTKTLLGSLLFCPMRATTQNGESSMP